MRLWSIHPAYLDAKGIVAVWREALLAQAVLAGRTNGYRRHPQLDRFRAAADPRAAIEGYLRAVLEEARRRGYSFDERLIDRRPAARSSEGTGDAGGAALPIDVTAGQLEHERRLLAAKLAVRAPALVPALQLDREPRPHPLFRRVPGEVEAWERLRERHPRFASSVSDAVER